MTKASMIWLTGEIAFNSWWCSSSLAAFLTLPDNACKLLCRMHVCIHRCTLRDYSYLVQRRAFWCDGKRKWCVEMMLINAMFGNRRGQVIELKYWCCVKQRAQFSPIVSRNIIICLYAVSFWKPQSWCKRHYAKWVYGVLQSSSVFNECWANLSSTSICEEPQLHVHIHAGK